MIKAVILDFGGVVFTNKPKEEWLGPKGELDIDWELWNKARLGQVEDRVIFREIAKNYGEDPIVIQRWLFSRRQPSQKLLSLLDTLKPGVKKAVINNGLKSLFYGFFQRNSGVANHFDVLVNSAEEGVKKPDPKIYQITCQRLGVKPGECIFVDDDNENIKGAENFGMKGIFFTNLGELKKEFEKLGLIGK